MDPTIQHLINRGVVESTLKSYGAGKRTFFHQCDYRPFPVSELLLKFVAFIFQESLSYQTIKHYLSAVQHFQIISGFPDPAMTTFPRLNYALKGIRRDYSSPRRKARLPITPNVLTRIFKIWSQHPVTFDRLMLWAAFCLAFFGFMRSGEFTCPSIQAFTPDMLSPDDIAVNSHTALSFITVHLKRSKNDPFGAGTTLHLGATGSCLCPVAAVLGYKAYRPPIPGPLFIFSDGSPLSRSSLISCLKQALSTAGVDDSGFSGHSFRIGAATIAAEAGFSDSFIRLLGR